MTLNNTGQRYPIHVYVLKRFPSPKFHSVFRVTGRFETNATNDPKMTLHNKRSKEPHINVYSSTPSPRPPDRESQILLCAIFKLQAILKEVHWMTPKRPGTLKGQIKVPCIHFTPTHNPPCQISPHFTLRLAFFPLQGIMRQVYRMNLK